MRATTERHSPDRVRTPEDRVLDCMHRFAYELVEEHATPDDRLLDVGFGEGYGSTIVRPHVREYVGVEVERDAVENAILKYSHPNVSFIHYDGAVLPVENASCRIVVAFQVIEHVKDAVGLLREISRVAAPGATVLIVTPNRSHRLDDGERPWNRYHVREFSPDELQATMKVVFSDVQVLGIRGSAVMEGIERTRVARARRLARFDPLGIRYVLPERFDTWLRSLVRRRRSNTVWPQDAQTEISVEQMYCSADDVEASLDLLAVAHTSA